MSLALQGVDEPGVDEPGVDEPGVDEPSVDEPGVDEPGVVVSTLACVRLERPLTFSALTYCTLLNKIHWRLSSRFNNNEKLVLLYFYMDLNVLLLITPMGHGERKRRGKGEAQDRAQTPGLCISRQDGSHALCSFRGEPMGWPPPQSNLCLAGLINTGKTSM